MSDQYLSMLETKTGRDTSQLVPTVILDEQFHVVFKIFDPQALSETQNEV